MLHLTIDKAAPKASHSDDDSDGAENAAATPGIQRKSKLIRKAIYRCPVYVNFKKNRVANHAGAEGQMITHVPIPLKGSKASFWTARNICLVCYDEKQLA